MISIIVPAHNAARHIGACLAALAQQRNVGDEYEVIVVDDGSTDGTGDVARAHDIRVLRQRHKGPGAARNYGAKQAAGSLLLFTDADCEPDLGWAGRMAQVFARPEVVGAKGAYRTRQRSLIARFVQREFEDKYDHLRKSEYIDFIDTYSAAYRREIFLASGGFDAGFRQTSLEDQDFSFSLASVGHKMVFVPEAIVYHQHPDTLMSYLKRKFWVGYWRVLIQRRHPEKALSDSRTPPSLRFQVGLAGLLPLTILAGPVTTLLLPLVILLLFFLTTLPFAVKAFRKDWPAGLVAPFLLLARAAALGVGFVAGAIGMVKPKSNL